MTGSAEGLLGNAVRVAQRIRDCAAAGEVLVSGTVRDLVAGSGLEFEARGRIEAGPLGEWQLLQWKNPADL
jgi:class 3 adenylate cyclase